MATKQSKKRQVKETTSQKRVSAKKPRSTPKITVLHKSPMANAIDGVTGNNSKEDIVDLTYDNVELNQEWGDLNSLYNNLAEAIVTISTEVSNALKKLTESSIEIPKEVALASKTLYSDLTLLSEDISTILKSHEGKKGRVKNDDELAMVLEIYNQYYLCFDRLKALTFNPLLEITERLMSLKVETKDTDTDVTVVSDAIVVDEVNREPSKD